MKRYKIGYTQGTFDMFHKGHLNLLRRAKELCDYLVVGVNSDALVLEYKGNKPIICAEDRAYIVENIKVVDQCIIVDTLDKEVTLERIPYNVVFIGDDWKGKDRWIATERSLAAHGIDVVYFPYTEGVSSTELKEKFQQGGVRMTRLDDRTDARRFKENSIGHPGLCRGILRGARDPVLADLRDVTRGDTASGVYSVGR